MIQRLQTIYMFLAVAFISFLFRFPFSNASRTKLGPYRDGDLDIYDSIFLLASVIVIIVCGIINIFLYNNRKRQMLVSMILAILSVETLSLGLIFTFTAGVTTTLNAGIFIPIVPTILFILAYRGIKKDDDLVKSSNRLR